MSQSVWIWILSILFLGSAAFGGWIYYDKVYRAEGGKGGGGAEEAVAPCDPLKTFTGDQVKISFQYPESWGDATEKVINAADSADDVTAAGKSFEIGFSKNPYITFSGASSDFESAGIGGACPIRNYFSGEGQNYQCASQNETSGEVASCKEISIDGQNAVSLYYIPGNDCSLLSISKVVYSPTTDEQFPGFVIEMRVSWADDLQVADMGSRIADGSATGSQATFLQGKIDEFVNAAKSELGNGSYTNYLMDLQLSQSDALVGSIQFAD